MVAQVGSEKLDLSLMWQVKDKLQNNYLDKSKIVDKDMVYGSIVGMVQSLGDPYTVFLPPKENKSANEDLAGAFGGVGIQLGYKEKTLAVMAPLPKTPAEKAGIKAGDLILKIIDAEKKLNKDTSGIALDEAVSLIRGKLGTDVTLTLYREGKPGTFDVTMKRENIVVPSLEFEIKEVKGKKYAWIKLYKFSDQLYKDWPELVDKVIIEKNKDGNNFGGIVLDLRNNPGGFLQASVLVASDFIKEGVIVKQASANGQDQTYNVENGRGKMLDEKLVVLINGGSASASEILAGALKDYKRAKLVGEKSFGKGTVQSPQDFPDGSGIHITIAKWLLPSGKNIHGEGVMPDVEVKYVDNDKKLDNQLDKAIEVLNEK
jgi:carboxyl-terminal processing protease